MFNRKPRVRAETQGTVGTDSLLSSLIQTDEITKNQALCIPSVQFCINLIANIISSVPFYLYEQSEDDVKKITDDNRLFLVNHDTKDTMTASQFWKQMVEDYYLERNGANAYLNRVGNNILSIHYVEASNIALIKNNDAIFKKYEVLVQGDSHYPYEFLRILRKTSDGVFSKSVIQESNLALAVAYDSLTYEQNLVKKGGNKRGFLKSAKKLTEPALESLKDAFKRLYSNSRENVVVLNDGVEFQESSNTSVEMQLNENKETNSKEIAKIFCIPGAFMGGSPTSDDCNNLIKYCIMPLINDIEESLDRDLLLEKEKRSYYFAADARELTRGSVKERYEAYKMGLEANFLQIDEVRNEEDLEPLGINWITLGLDKVLYNPKTGEVYTPNTDKTTNVIEKGSEIEDENRDKE